MHGDKDMNTKFWLNIFDGRHCFGDLIVDERIALELTFRK
jgi:hypothetical protein